MQWCGKLILALLLRFAKNGDLVCNSVTANLENKNWAKTLTGRAFAAYKQCFGVPTACKWRNTLFANKTFLNSLYILRTIEHSSK